MPTPARRPNVQPDAGDGPCWFSPVCRRWRWRRASGTCSATSPGSRSTTPGSICSSRATSRRAKDWPTTARGSWRARPRRSGPRSPRCSSCCPARSRSGSSSPASRRTWRASASPSRSAAGSASRRPAPRSPRRWWRSPTGSSGRRSRGWRCRCSSSCRWRASCVSSTSGATRTGRRSPSCSSASRRWRAPKGCCCRCSPPPTSPGARGPTGAGSSSSPPARAGGSPAWRSPPS